MALSLMTYRLVSFASIEIDRILWEETCWVRTSGGLGLVGSWRGHKNCFMFPLLVATKRKPNSSLSRILVAISSFSNEGLEICLSMFGWISFNFKKHSCSVSVIFEGIS